jgi:hypothetical protein
MALRERQKTDETVEAIEQLGLHAKPVPLTGQVRFELKDLLGLVEDLRQALAEERGKGERW